MNPMSIVMVHPDASAASVKTCNLASLVTSRGGSTIPFSSIDHFNPAPAILIVEAAAWPEWPVTVRTLRQRWPSAAAMAVFQNNPVKPEALSMLDDFLCEPVRETELAARLQRLLTNRPILQDCADLESFKAEHQLTSLVGGSASFASAVRKIPLLARVDATVLITGETGTGKELFARALHYTGPRRNGPFVPCNCGALPDHLLENELFGHAAGAYTDARSEQKGLLAIADGGTLLLDEIDSLSLCGQAKLLRFLQDREYRPLGSDRTRRANVRVLASTNRRLSELVERRQIREDLFHRLNVLQFHVPPLRERESDVLLLSQVFLRRACAQIHRPLPRFTADAMEAMRRYTWPGNVRELESIVQRVVVLCTSTVIEASDIGLTAGSSVRESSLVRFDQAKRQTIEGFERNYVVRVLSEAAGNVSRAARLAGTERRTFQRLMRKHALRPTSFLS